MLVLGLLAYTNAIFHPFVHDDVVFIENNPRIADFNLKKFSLILPCLTKNDFMVTNNLAAGYLEIGEFEKGEQLLNKILKENPQSAVAKKNLEKLLSLTIPKLTE